MAAGDLRLLLEVRRRSTEARAQLLLWTLFGAPSIPLRGGAQNALNL
jgi:hypothetical protein